MEYYSATNKNEIMPCSNMDGSRDYHTKWSSQTNRNIKYYHSYVDFKNDTNELIYKTERDSQT